MDKLKMMSMDKVQGNVEKIRALFPNAVTEVIRDGKPTLAVDFDVLKQELADTLIDDRELRYQFTWPDKQKAVLAANTPISKTLRPCKEESVDFDNTQNLYIEGDNLEVLKLIQETYHRKIKMIYIDPPYNTGNDFVYNDDFSQSAEDYAEVSGQYDEQGNRLLLNTESRGRFHTDWLNMIYPRLRLAKDLLSDDGVIFISIDDNEQSNLKKLCDEVFGNDNCLGVIANINNPKGRSDDKYIATAHEYLLVYAKDIKCVEWYGFEPTEEILKRYNKVDAQGKRYREIDLRKTGENDLREDRPNLFYYFYYSEITGDFYPDYKNYQKDGYIQIKPLREDGKEGNWRWGFETAKKQIDELLPKFMPSRKVWGVMQKDYLEGRSLIKPTSSWTFKDVNSERGTEEFIELGFDKRVFPKPKPLGTIKRCLKLSTGKNDIVLDFFSGSATTAHAVMQLNAEDGGNRRFIMVQLPEACDEKSEAYKAGYKNICEIGKERIRRAGKKLAEDLYDKKWAITINGQKVCSFASAMEILEPKEKQIEKIKEEIKNLDVGFRVLKLDSSNMKDVYYNPEEYSQSLLDSLEDNIKSDRTPLDLLFQVMLELGKPLSAKIEERDIAGKKVFIVDDNDLIACFDSDITEETVKAIAKLQPLYAVFRDSSLSSDSTAANFEQIFATYSPNTVKKIL